MENERIYVMEDKNGQPIICSCEEYLKFILNIIKNTPNDTELGKIIRNEYDNLRLSLIILFNDNIKDEEQIPY